MRVYVATLFFLALIGSQAAVSAPDRQLQPLLDKEFPPREIPGELLLRPPAAGLRGDTTWYGQYEIIGDEVYALPFDNKYDACWTFDRGTGPVDPPAPLLENGEGWSVFDMSANVGVYSRVIDETLDLGEGVPPPIISGEQSLWIGADKLEADSMCWACGPGYGNAWCQRATSPPLNYDGAGDVTLSFRYWSFSEPCYDGTQVYLKGADGSELMLNPYPPGQCDNNTGYEGGTFTDSIGHYTNPAEYTRLITELEIGGAQDIQIIFEFTSDGGWSDEDCIYTTTWGPFGADDISIAGGGIDASFDFEDGLQGWLPEACPRIGDFVDIADVGCYTLQDACFCKLDGNILEMHDGLCDSGFHPVGQVARVVSPICDLGGPDWKTIFIEFDWNVGDMFLWRLGWRYYPHVCEVTGTVGWSNRVGWDQFINGTQGCYRRRLAATEMDFPSGVPVPPTAEKVMAIVEVSRWGDVMDPSPLFDNIAIGVVPAANAPAVGFATTTERFQDVGSHPSDQLDPRAPGPANSVFDQNWNEPGYRYYSGDSLVISGPQPESPETRWEARLWWRVAKRAPFQADLEDGIPSRYKIWKERTSDGAQIDRPDRAEFASAWMDSVDHPQVYRNKFKSDFREDDDDFVGEELEENEIIWDDVLYPGSKVEYFITTNYIYTPSERFYLPDTSGGYFYEFEVLPGFRLAHVPECGGAGRDYCVFQPATLYIDACDYYYYSPQLFIENALRTVLNGMPPCQEPLGCPMPDHPNWDRYDMQRGACCYNVPFARGSIAGSNNGMTLHQIIGYRAILLNIGHYADAPTHDADFVLFDQWLTSPECSANANRQVFVFNGDRVGNDIFNEEYGEDFIYYTLGAWPYCDAFNGSTGDPDCGAENTSYCLRLLEADGGAYPTEIDIDAYGNWCPNQYSFNLFNAVSGGVGNRYFSAEDGLKEMHFAQVTREDLSPDANYRTVVGGPSWHHLTARDAGGQGMDRCPRDLPSIVAAAIEDIGGALKWGFGVEDYESIPKLASVEELADCQGTWETMPSDAGELVKQRVNRLYQNEPNPFNPSTTVRFSLAQSGLVRVAIYDVNGRLIKTLVDGKRYAGLHTVPWDGTNESDKPVGTGVYWSQMRAGMFVSNKKMIVLK